MGETNLQIGSRSGAVLTQSRRTLFASRGVGAFVGGGKTKGKRAYLRLLRDVGVIEVLELDWSLESKSGREVRLT